MRSFLVAAVVCVMAFSAASCSLFENTAEIDAVKEVSDKSEFDSAIDGSTTSKDFGADFDHWVKITDYSGKDQTYHNIYLRVTKVTTETEDEKYVEDAVKLHNSFVDSDKKINIKNPALSDEGEWCVMDYDIYIPDDFPAYDGEIIPPDISFDVTDLGDSADGASSIISFGLGTQKNLLVAEEPEHVEVGKIYSYRFLYAMAKGNTDYMFYHTELPEGTPYEHEDVETINVYYNSK